MFINTFKKKYSSLNLISIIQKEDQRIKIIRNQKNMGILYIFDTITKLSDKGNFDIVEFKAISNKK